MYYKEAYKDYCRKGFHNPKYSVTEEDINKFSSMLENRENFTLVRYNDGEWIYGLRIEPFVTANMERKNHNASIFQISDRLIQIIDSEPDYYISTDVYSRIKKGVKEKVAPYLDKIKNPLGAGIFNMWSMQTGFLDLFAAMNERKTLVVGLKELRKIPSVYKSDFIETKAKVHYVTDEIIAKIEAYMEKNYEKDMIIIYSCSFTAKIAADHFYKKYGNTITQLDVGAALQPFLGSVTRPWHRVMRDEIKKYKNKGILPLKHLSVLKNAKDRSITYYVGDNPEHIKHLQNLNKCTLICKPEMDLSSLTFKDTEIIRTEDPQLYFYKLSKEFKKDYLDQGQMEFRKKYCAYIHRNCVIGDNVRIAPGCVIGPCKIGDNVRIDANVTIYGETVIGDNVIIEAGTVIGSAGMMWVWDGDNRVYLEQLGNVVIEEDCRIGSQIEIVRGSANESTVIGKGSCIAHGTLIGHGCQVGKYAHFANGVKLGGSVVLGDYNFLGSGSIVSPGVRIECEDVVLGAGSTLTKNVTEEGVYVGSPAKWIKSTTGKLSGMPTWRK